MVEGDTARSWDGMTYVYENYTEKMFYVQDKECILYTQAAKTRQTLLNEPKIKTQKQIIRGFGLKYQISFIFCGEG